MNKTDSRSTAHRCQSAGDPHLRRHAQRAAVHIAIFACCLWASAAGAHLGGTSDTLETEGVTLRVSAHRVEHRTLYDVHYLTRTDGEIRQYSDHTGRIFAVAWQTHQPVSLAKLLEAPATGAVVARAAAQPSPAVAGGRHTASIVADDRVVHLVKMSHMFMGVAQLSSKIPRGVDVKELR